MKRSKKPLTFAAVAATIGALSMAVEGCVYGPPPSEVNVYGPPPDDTISEQTEDSLSSKPEKNPDGEEVCVYGPAPDDTLDTEEVDVYGPPAEG